MVVHPCRWDGRDTARLGRDSSSGLGAAAATAAAVAAAGTGHVRVNNSRNVGSSRRLNAQGVPCREETP